MPKNEILPFGLGSGANVATQATWDAETQRLTGFQSGVAKSSHLNKAWRQSSFIAHVFAQLISEAANVDVLDNGDIATLKARMRAAIYAVAGSGPLSDELAAYKKLVDSLFAGVNGNIGRVDSGLTSAVARVASLESRMNGRLLHVPAWGAAGSYVHNFHPECSYFLFELVGGGGAGGGGQRPAAGQCTVGSGGGSGGYSAGIYFNRKARIGNSINILVGAGGAGVNGGAGGTGGTTSLGTLAHAFGGGGAGSIGPTALGMGNNGGGAPSGSIYSEAGFGGGHVLAGGTPGMTGLVLAAGHALGGAGAPGPWGGGAPASGQNSYGPSATGYGAGGGGCCLLAGQGPTFGGNGSPGFVRLWEYA